MRLIDADKAISDYAHYGISHPYDAYDLEDILTECQEIEATPKDQYEARLRGDIVAVLDEIRAEISWHIIEDDTSGNTPARLRADWEAANKAHRIDIAIIDKYRV